MTDTAKSDNKTKTTWNIIKNETGRMNPTEQVPSSLVNMGTLKDQRTVANDFKTFCNNFRKIKQIQI
jgi:hypothetical protein